MFSGSITALITPFRNGRLDETAFQALVDWQIDQGTHGLVPCGTTGESPVLSPAEHARVVAMCLEVANGRVPVIAGAGSNVTEHAIALAGGARQQGANAALVVVPYYNKPTQEGMFQHFKAVHDAVDIPIVLYNVPGRTVVELSVETIERLAALPNIVGIKDASTDLTRPKQIREFTDESFCLLSGEDGTTHTYLKNGGQGCISVTSNVAPKVCASMHEAWQAGDLVRFEALCAQLAPLHESLFFESNPAPVKYAVSKFGISTDEMRLPLVRASQVCQDVVNTALDQAGITSQDFQAWPQNQKNRVAS